MCGYLLVCFYAVIGCHWLLSLKDLHSNLAAIAVIFCKNDSVATGYSCIRGRCAHLEQPRELTDAADGVVRVALEEASTPLVAASSR
jgi:hypothetical protein